MILLSAYSISMCQRLIFDSIRLSIQDKPDNDNSIEQFLRIFLLIQRIIDRVTQYMLFRYILEMRDVRLKLESLTFESYNLQKKNQRRLENLNLVVLIVVSLPIAILGYLDIDHDVELGNKVNYVYMVLRPLSLIFSIIMFIIFVDLIKFF